MLKSLRFCTLVAAAVAGGAFATTASAQLPAPVLHVSFDDVANDTELTTFSSRAIYRGVFSITREVINTPSIFVETIAGEKAVTFANNAALRSGNVVPAEMLGANPWTVYARAYNPEYDDNVGTLIHWGTKWADGANAALNLDDHANGAYQHWYADAAYNPLPTPGVWHDIVLTYDGNIEILYVDGVVNGEPAQRTLNIGNGAAANTLSFTLGADRDNENNLTGSIAKIQAYPRALTAQEVQNLIAGNTAGLPTPLLNLDASNLPEGELTQWTSTGSVNATFNPVNIPPSVRPTVVEIEGVKGLQLSGIGFRGDEIVPPSIKGNNPWTAYFRFYNPSVEAEEIVVEWAGRNRGTGTYAFLGIGSQPTWGAAAHWGDPDLGYINVPEAGRWNQVAIVFDGAEERIYVNGVLDNTEAKTLNIGNGQENDYFYIGQSHDPNVGTTSFVLNALEIFPVALTPEQINQLPYGPFDVLNSVDHWTLFD